MEIYLEILTAVRDSVGPSEFLNTHREAALHALALPAFDSVVKQLLHVMGRRAMVRGFPTMWEQTLRGCGQAAVRQPNGDGDSQILFTRVPPELVEHDAYRESVQAMLEALMIRASSPGHVELTGRAQDSIEFTMRRTGRVRREGATRTERSNC